jgi:hypothetical protein
VHRTVATCKARYRTICGHVNGGRYTNAELVTTLSGVKGTRRMKIYANVSKTTAAAAAAAVAAVGARPVVMAEATPPAATTAVVVGVAANAAPAIDAMTAESSQLSTPIISGVGTAAAVAMDIDVDVPAPSMSTTKSTTTTTTTDGGSGAL